MNLPISAELEISKLTQVFNNTSATYKFYWFLSVIDSIENNQREIPKKDLFIKMLSIPWYTVNYFHMSLGSQDLIQNSIKALSDIENLGIAEKQDFIQRTLNQSKNANTKNIISHLDKNVPHWFLSPWFKGSNRNEIYQQ